MSDDPVPAIDIIEEHGSFLLVRAGSLFGVVERRAGKIYGISFAYNARARASGGFLEFFSYRQRRRDAIWRATPPKSTRKRVKSESGPAGW
jgi:hypothetical protein